MDDSLINVRFSCQATRCNCEVIVEARVIARPNQERFYEYNVESQCPKCGHRLFGLHRPTAETPAKPDSS